MTEAANKNFEKLYSENFSYVYNSIYMKILDAYTAEDICSTTFLKAYVKFGEYDPLSAKKCYFKGGEDNGKDSVYDTGESGPQ